MSTDVVAAARWLSWQTMRAGRLDLAQVLIDGVCAVDPSDVWAARMRAEVALARGDGLAAHEAAGAWLREAPEDGDAMFAYARALLSLDENASATRWLSAAADRGVSLAKAVLKSTSGPLAEPRSP